MSEERTLYEGIYILDTSLSEAQVSELVAALEAAVAEAGAEVVATRDFGTRRLAYPIAHRTSGMYKLLYFRGERPAVEAFQHECAVRPGVLRARCYVANPEAIVRGDSGPTVEAPLDEEPADDAAGAQAAGAPEADSGEQQ